MSISHLETAKKLREQGKRLGRAGVSERIFTLVDEFNKNRSYKNAVVLAGKLKALSQVCKFDGYWDEKCQSGFINETYDIERVSLIGTLPNSEESWWIK